MFFAIIPGQLHIVSGWASHYAPCPRHFLWGDNTLDDKEFFILAILGIIRTYYGDEVVMVG